MEADVYPKNRPERADLIDGTLGEGSPFHDVFGYYAPGVDETTAVLPRGWRDRLIPIRNPNTRDNTGWCLEPHDLVVSKTIAGPEKYLQFLAGAAKGGLVDLDTLRKRLAETVVDDDLRVRVIARFGRAFVFSVLMEENLSL